MDKLQIKNLREYLQKFELNKLFTEVLGWSTGRNIKPLTVTLGEKSWQATPIAELSGVVAYRVIGIPEYTDRQKIHREISQRSHENLVIFVDHETPDQITQSLWLWVKKEGKKYCPREHLYVRGQPGDLFISKISGIIVDINELDADGNFPLAQLIGRMKSALDVEKVTKKFFRAYDEARLHFVQLIEGIPDDKDRRWYASVLMNRLMFVWFLQRKGFLDNNNLQYLSKKLAISQQKGSNLFYSEFLQILFFEGFAKPATARSTQTHVLIGNIHYLNGGLFVPHRLEREYGSLIRVPDIAFENLFQLFSSYSWNLNDTPGGDDDEINPDVLGYIFEKYINQKAFGAYYTRPEITEYLCERTVHRLILARIKQPKRNLADILLNLDAKLCQTLLDEVLPDLKLLDPACGSGAFLVAAMKTLINIYSAIIGRIRFLNNPVLTEKLAAWEAAHKSLAYFIKRSIITDNLFGVDLMEEATEIAKLRLFLALVASAQTIEQLEPLPNIDFNILSGNSLIGLVNFDPEAALPTTAPVTVQIIENISGQTVLFDDDASLASAINGKEAALRDIHARRFKELIEHKNRSITAYKQHAQQPNETEGLDQAERVLRLREDIDKVRAEGNKRLNTLLLQQMQMAGIKFEQATWDDNKNKEGKPVKRALTEADVEALQPFHWGFEFDDIFQKRGGFDAIITNPPWESFKPLDKEFAKEHDASIERRGTSIKEFEAALSQLLKKSSVREEYLQYLSSFPHASAWFRTSPQFRNQSAIVGGKKTGSDINLYKLFTEQCVNLLKNDGECGIVIPSGIYSDLGAKGLRDMLFNENRVTGLFCFENRKTIFEGVDSRFKFVVLTFEKGGKTLQFPATFMRHDVAELASFPTDIGLDLSVELIRRLSPDSHSVMEFKSETDIKIAEKMLTFPLLGETLEGTWNLRFTREFDMTNDSGLFKTEPKPDYLPLYEGKMIWHFEHGRSDFRYWIDKSTVRKDEIKRRSKLIRKKLEEHGKNSTDNQEFPVSIPYEFYRLGFRSITGATNERALVVSILSPNVVTGNSLTVSQPIVDTILDGKWTEVRLYQYNELLAATALLSSFVCDWFIRQKILTNMNMFYVYQIPVPRLTQKSDFFEKLVGRAARLLCTNQEFDELASEVGLGSHINSAIEPDKRAQLRAEIDGLVAHIYGLTEDEFAHVLSTFPLVPDSIKAAAIHAYRDVASGFIK